MDRIKGWSRASGTRPVIELIGRDTDVAAVEDTLASSRLVTLVGGGGVGKSMIAKHVFERVRSHTGHRTAWVDLAWVSTPDELPIAWSQALGTSVVDLQSLVRTIDGIGDVLLAVDNCEHVAGAVAPIIENIVSECARARVLATSRERLDIVGEQLWRLAGLPCPPAGSSSTSQLNEFPAARLFVVRSLQVNPKMSFGDAAATDIGEICRLVEGNPLAIILAAGHVGAISLSELRRSVASSNALMSGRGASAGARHTSIDASVRWSIDLLGPVERDVLIRLAVFPTAFDLEAASVVGGSTSSDGAVAASVARLVDHGLVNFDGEHYYQLPFVVRRFALGLGHGDPAFEAAGAQHAHLILGWAASVTTWGATVDPVSIDARAVEIHAALAWAMDHDPHLADRSFASFGVMLHGAVRRQYVEWMSARTDRDLDWARAVGWLAILAPADAVPMLAEALPAADRIAMEAADEHVQRLIACTGVQQAIVRGDLRPARQLVAAARESRDGWVVVASATTASFVAAMLGLVDDVASLCDSARWACEQGGLPYSTTVAPLAEALVAHRAGRAADAHSLIRAARGPEMTASALHSVRAVMAFDGGDVDALDEIQELMKSPTDPLGCHVRARATVGALIARFDFDAAIGTAREAMGGGPIEDAELSLAAAAALLRAGHSRSHVLDELARARKFVSSIPEHSPAFDAPLGLLHAQVLLGEGDVDAASRHLFAALDAARLSQQRLTTIDALETVAELSRCRGGVRSAGAVVKACARARIELGYRASLLSMSPALDPGSAHDAIDLDAAIGLAMRTRGARRRPSTGMASLTPTELAVVDLVVAGRTNAEIATELMMAPTTVKSHLTHVFRKVDVANRTQLAVTIGQWRAQTADQ